MKETVMALVVGLMVGAGAFLLYSTVSSEAQVVPENKVLTVPVVAHIVRDDTGQYSSQRDRENILALFAEANRLWSAADIQLVIEDVVVSEFTTEEFEDVLEGQIPLVTSQDDFAQGTINAYFAQRVGANGISFPAQGFFLESDRTTVHDFRTAAHEVGHIFGLRHIAPDFYLMARGTNGEFLSPQEIEAARAVAEQYNN